MGGMHVGDGVYTYKQDKDAAGTYYWIVAPNGKLLAYVDSMSFVDTLLTHLNRKR